MPSHQQLGQLSGLQQMMQHLLQSVPETDCHRRFHSDLPPLAWLYGRSVWLECYWLREVLYQDDQQTRPLRHLFAATEHYQLAELPTCQRLLDWGGALHDEHLFRLANPTQLPGHPQQDPGVLLLRLLQQLGELLELMLAQLHVRQLVLAPPLRDVAGLQRCQPSSEHVDLHQGHFRIGAKHDPAALDDELPPNIVELHAFRIDRHPVSNGAWLGFIEEGGYQRPELWDEQGWAWSREQPPHPLHWRQARAGAWYGVGLNGPYALQADDAVHGISHHEAMAYARWLASQGEDWTGAVLQHEYQWEVALRSRAIGNTGRVWEWCANPYHRYSGYLEPQDPEAASQAFDAGQFSVRGGCLHSQPQARRSSARRHALPGQRMLFCGTRLVFPPRRMPWHK